MSQTTNFWDRLNQFARGVKLDSISICGARLKYTPEATSHDSFGQILNKINHSSKLDIAIISAHNMDEVTIVDRISPDHESEAQNLEVKVPGGSGANSSCALASLGANVGITGIVGHDENGGLLVRSLEEAGVDTTMMLIDVSGQTGKTTTLVEEGGQRFIVVHPGVNNNFAEKMDLSSLIDFAASSKILHMSSFAGSNEFKLQEALLNKVGPTSVVSLNPGALYAKRGLDRLESMIKHVDVAFLYRHQLQQLLGNSSAKTVPKDANSRDLLESYFSWKNKRNLDAPQTLIIKDPLKNINGSIDQRFLTVGVGNKNLERYFGPKELPNGVKWHALDTTGSGDAAAAGFLHGMLNGAPLDACIDAAFLMASFAAAYVGGRTAFHNNEKKGAIIKS